MGNKRADLAGPGVGTYEEVARSTGERRELREEFIASMRDRIQGAMDENGIECAVQGRAKHLFSAYRKMVAQSLAADEIFDLMDPAAPECVGDFPLLGEGKDITILGDHAYVAAGFSGLYVLPAGTSLPM